MKTREGFVSHSSTTSFTCEVSGDTEPYHDSIGWSEIGACACENGHNMWDRYIIGGWSSIDWTEMIQELADKHDNGDTSSYYEDGEVHPDVIMESRHEGFPAKFCPICQFQVMSENDEYAYLQKLAGVKSKKELLVQVKEQFQSYEEFQAFLKEK